MESKDFEECFLEAFQKIMGAGLSQMASLFDMEKLSGLLTEEARRAEMPGSDPFSKMLILPAPLRRRLKRAK